MNIRQALYQKLTEPTVVDSFYAKIYVKGVQKSFIPIDFRLRKGRITLPIKDDDMYFHYKTKTEPYNVCRGEFLLSRYYPIGTTLTLQDMTLKVTGYGEPVTVAGATRVPVYTISLNQDESSIIEVVTNKSIEERVKKELESILISNDVIKRSLPYYRYDWLNYTEDNISPLDMYDSMRSLFGIKMMESAEYEYKANDGHLLLNKDTFDELSEHFNSFVERMNFEKMSIRYNRTSLKFNLISICKWILYHREFNKGRLFLKSYYGDDVELIIRKGNNKSVVIYMMTPDAAYYDYRLELVNVVKCNMNNAYYEYVMDNIKLYSIMKSGPDKKKETELVNLTGDGITDSRARIHRFIPFRKRCKYGYSCINVTPPWNSNSQTPWHSANLDQHNHHHHRPNDNLPTPVIDEDAIVISDADFDDTFFMIYVNLIRFICASPQKVADSGAENKDEYYSVLNVLIANYIRDISELIPDEDIYVKTAEEWRERYADVLALTVDTVEEDNRDDIEKAIDEYNHLPEEERHEVRGERILLDKLIETLDNGGEVPEEPTDQELAQTFRDKYADVLSETLNTVSEADRVNIVAAIAEYSELPESVREILAPEKTLLDELLNKLDGGDEPPVPPQPYVDTGATGMVIEDGNLWLTRDGEKIGNPIPISQISENIANESKENEATEFVMGTIEF